MKLAAVSISLLSVVLAACDGAGTSTTPAASPPASSAQATSTSAVSTTDPGQAWLGRWNGPEGTYLQLDATGGDSYDVRIKDLDAERTFKGIGQDGAVHFERDGKKESLKATDGDATGMKWLAGKTKCLTVHTGEGYCRD